MQDCPKGEKLNALITESEGENEGVTRVNSI